MPQHKPGKSKSTSPRTETNKGLQGKPKANRKDAGAVVPDNQRHKEDFQQLLDDALKSGQNPVKK
jgi:hypothetical protein